MKQESYTKNYINPLESLRNFLSKDFEAVNNLVEKEILSKVSLIPDLCQYTFSSGGKRLRPLLTLACAHLCGYKGKGHISLAAAVELIHTATLLHDDVIDGSKLRRGKETANKIWGNKECILVGDYLFAKSFELMGDTNMISILKILSRASVIISEGEVYQLEQVKDIASYKKKYLSIISAKTAELFASACKVGAILAKKTDDEVQSLANFGHNLGIAFQIVDDALDYHSSNKLFGKVIGNDFKEGKITLPIIIAYKKGNYIEQDFWNRTLIKGEQKETDFNYAVDFVSKHDAVRKSIIAAKKYILLAKEELNKFPDCQIRNILDEILNFVVDREF